MSNEHYETIDDTVYNIYQGMQLSSVTRKDENHWHIETGSGYFMNLSVIDRVVIADLAETEYELGENGTALIRLKGNKTSFGKIAEYMNWTCVPEQMWDIV